ncbi:MAG: DUF1648 domain-containing protein [Candidatus Sumerlaeota bacterium]|nr:DUF1648 domain-containing protein [Candidatus Sumerlaeota bacterium]
MFEKLRHPLWTHAPALCGLLASATLLYLAHAPERVPVHFGWSGQPDRWGSRFEMWLALVGIPLLMVIGSAVLDEMNARFEERKCFNWLALCDEALAGFFLGLTIRLAPQLSSPQPVLENALGISLAFAGAMAAVAAAIEFLRPHHPLERTAPESDHPSASPSALPSAFLKTIGSDQRWFYWETQNPLYLRIGIPLAALGILAGAIGAVPSQPWMLLVFLLLLILVVAMHGGLQVMINRERLTVRLGGFGLRLLKMPLENIASVQAESFNPIGDFGGWGIRYSLRKKMWGFYLYGAHGVKVELKNGKRYLLGSDNPDRLAAVCEAARSKLR